MPARLALLAWRAGQNQATRSLETLRIVLDFCRKVQLFSDTPKIKPKAQNPKYLFFLFLKFGFWA